MLLFSKDDLDIVDRTAILQSEIDDMKKTIEHIQLEIGFLKETIVQTNSPRSTILDSIFH